MSFITGEAEAKRRDSVSLARRVVSRARGAGVRPVAARQLNAASRDHSPVGLLQSIRVNAMLLPAHYQVPFSRLGPYDRSRLDALIYTRPRVHRAVGARKASILPVDTGRSSATASF